MNENETLKERERLESEVIRLTEEVNALIASKAHGELSDESILKEKRDELVGARVNLELAKMAENKEESHSKER